MIKLGNLLSILSGVNRIIIYSRTTNETIYVYFGDDNFFNLLNCHAKVEDINFCNTYKDKCIYIEISN